MYRFNPDFRAKDQNPFSWDSEAIDTEFGSYIEEEIRYKTLNLTNPNEARRLSELAVKDNEQRFKDIKHLSEI
jgi:hypothetical protein